MSIGYAYAQGKADIKFEQTTHNFGTFSENSPVVSYTFKFTVTGGGSPQFASGNTSFLQLTKIVQEGNDYFVTFKAVAAGQVGVYASADGPYMDRQCIIDVI